MNRQTEGKSLSNELAKERSRQASDRTLTPIKAMRKKCLDCCCGSSQEVKLCPVTDCALYPYRFGKYPKRTGTKGKINSGLLKIHQIAGEKI
jgi:hypothetical protein